MLSDLERDDEANELNRDKRIVKDVRLVSLVNRGSVGRIYKGVDVNNGKTIAVKIVDYLHEKYRARAAREATIHSFLKHKSIVELYRYYTRDNSSVMHMEFFPGVDLTVLTAQEGPIENSEAGRIADEVTIALTYMHSMRITHNDIHERTVMVNSEGDVKLVDFGSASMDTSTIDNDLCSARELYPYMAIRSP